ncbi:hypothetical protein ARHIZOSPH14_01430 [Agromyces rhizosphaerae]|uniref:Excalibur calcium-binding domain-containing protein n=2 Tax=Agromyces rhizosphaerae TaxID=88374 RepID=A0A9W6CNL7_9MICO|nr:hypothetical protein ARHIZOSPH14_01430 [Agromyces rhizosphaerae]
MSAPERRARLAPVPAAIALGVIAVVGAALLLPGLAGERTEAGAPTGAHANHGIPSDAGAASVGPAPSTAATATPSEEATDDEPGRTSIEPPVDQAPGTTAQTSLAQAASAPITQRDGTAGLGEARPAIAPEDTTAGDTGYGGCLVEYGENGQCLPTIPPSLTGHVSEMLEAGLDPSDMYHPWTCTEVREYFPDGIAVRQGVDPQGLDPDGDGTACTARDLEETR